MLCCLKIFLQKLLWLNFGNWHFAWLDTAMVLLRTSHRHVLYSIVQLYSLFCNLSIVLSFPFLYSDFVCSKLYLVRKSSFCILYCVFCIICDDKIGKYVVVTWVCIAGSFIAKQDINWEQDNSISHRYLLLLSHRASLYLNW